jgi:hypothetical protein
MGIVAEGLEMVVQTLKRRPGESTSSHWGERAWLFRYHMIFLPWRTSMLWLHSDTGDTATMSGRLFTDCGALINL